MTDAYDLGMLSLVSSAGLARPYTSRNISYGTGLQRSTWSRESESECAGSVDTTSVWCPAAASFTASDAARLVLPTPPFPEICTRKQNGLSFFACFDSSAFLPCR